MVVAYLNNYAMATELEFNYLDNKLHSEIKQITGQRNRTDINSIHKEIV